MSEFVQWIAAQTDEEAKEVPKMEAGFAPKSYMQPRHSMVGGKAGKALPQHNFLAQPGLRHGSQLPKQWSMTGTVIQTSGSTGEKPGQSFGAI